MDEDLQLILKLKEGDDSVFDKILDIYEKRIINFMYRFTGNQWDAEELAQEVFIKVYKGAQNYSPDHKFSTWLYRIAINTGIDFRRRSAKDASRMASSSVNETISTDEGDIQSDIEDKTAEESVTAAPEQAQLSENIADALSKLPKNQQAALILKVYEELSYAEISKILGVSVSSVESLIFRARTELKKILKPL